MKIVQESKRVLLNLHAEFLKDESAHAPFIEINMKDFAESVKVTKENLNLYLWFLHDAGYINCPTLEYNRSDDAKKKIFFLPKAIRMLEVDETI